MRCERVAALLPAYLDGDLAGRLNRTVSDHLDACDRCRGELAAQQRALRTLDAGRHPVSIDLWADFSRRLQSQSSPPPSPWRLWWQPGLATALAAAAITLVTLTAPKPHLLPAPAARAGFTQIANALRPRIDPVLEPARPAVEESADVVEPEAPPALVSKAHPPAFDRTVRRPRRALRRHGGLSPERPPRRHLLRRHSVKSSFPASPAPQAFMLAERLDPAALHDTSFPKSPGSSAPSQKLSTAAPSRDDARLVAPDSSSPTLRRPPARAGDPLRVAEALVSVEEDAASDQVKGELLRMAQEVARVGGEAGDREDRAPGAARVLPVSGPASSVTESTGG